MVGKCFEKNLVDHAAQVLIIATNTQNQEYYMSFDIEEN